MHDDQNLKHLEIAVIYMVEFKIGELTSCLHIVHYFKISRKFRRHKHQKRNPMQRRITKATKILFIHLLYYV